MAAFSGWLSGVAQPWADLYGRSPWVSTGVQFLHLTGLLVAGGFALAFDRATLRLGAATTGNRSSFLEELSAVHGPVILGLGVVVITGVALLLADVDALLPSRVFWMKMGVFALLLLNGISIRHAGGRLSLDAGDPRRWRALRRGSLRSVVLWISLVFLGVLLTTA